MRAGRAVGPCCMQWDRLQALVHANESLAFVGATCSLSRRLVGCLRRGILIHAQSIGFAAHVQQPSNALACGLAVLSGRAACGGIASNRLCTRTSHQLSSVQHAASATVSLTASRWRISPRAIDGLCLPRAATTQRVGRQPGRAVGPCCTQWDRLQSLVHANESPTCVGATCSLSGRLVDCL